MRTTASTGGKSASTESVTAKEPSGTIEIPVREVEGVEGIALGFRQTMLTMGDEGEVLTGGGLGTDFIILKWGEKEVFVRGSELLKAWVAQFDPEAAERFPV